MTAHRNYLSINPGKKNFRISQWLNGVLTVLLAGIIITGCKDSATGDNGPDKETKTYNLVLTSDGSKIGEIMTARITEDDDAYIDEGFFATLTISDMDFKAPFDMGINNDGGYCGTFDVQAGEKAEMPCDYDDYLSNPDQLIITSENGDGIEAHPSP